MSQLTINGLLAAGLPYVVEIPDGATLEEARALIDAVVEQMNEPPRPVIGEGLARRLAGESAVLRGTSEADEWRDMCERFEVIQPRPEDCKIASEGRSPRCGGCKQEWWGRGRLCDRCKPPRFNPRGAR